MTMSHHAVAVLITSPEGVPMVRDPKKPAPQYWKLPGGRSESSESPEECAVREVFDEVGVRLASEQLRIIGRQNRETHTLTFFRADLSSLDGLKIEGDEQEEVKVFAAQEVLQLPDLFPNHKSILQRELTT
jgi:8-oxo-dGTP diphosphatase